MFLIGCSHSDVFAQKIKASYYQISNQSSRVSHAEAYVSFAEQLDLYQSKSDSLNSKIQGVLAKMCVYDKYQSGEQVDKMPEPDMIKMYQRLKSEQYYVQEQIQKYHLAMQRLTYYSQEQQPYYVSKTNTK